jgi:hypothetical protein
MVLNVPSAAEVDADHYGKRLCKRKGILSFGSEDEL